MGSFQGKKPFPVKWGDEGVDVSRDEFIVRWGSQKDKRYHVGANFKVNQPKDMGEKAAEKYACMVGKCTGLIDEKPKEE
jgi:hypothetical protein